LNGDKRTRGIALKEKKKKLQRDQKRKAEKTFEEKNPVGKGNTERGEKKGFGRDFFEKKTFRGY